MVRHADQLKLWRLPERRQIIKLFAVSAVIGKKYNIMDDKTKTGSPDRDLININEAYEVRDWADKFGVSHAKLKEAVAAVGTSARKVEAWLKNNR